MKFRHRKVKREHGIIQDALGWLEELGRLPEVSDIIPGVIEVSRSPERGLVYKYETQTGCKLLLKSNGSVQEAFVVTKQPEAVKQWVERNGHIEPRTQPQPRPDTSARVSKQGGRSEKQRTARARTEQLAGRERSPQPERQARRERPRIHERDDFGDQAWTEWPELAAGDPEAPSVGELLGADVRSRLRELQRSLRGKAAPGPKSQTGNKVPKTRPGKKSGGR